MTLSYPFLLLIAGICMALAAGAFLMAPAWLPAFARNRITGAGLGAWMLSVCVPHVEQLFGPDSMFGNPALLWGAAAVLWVLLILYADYLCARALAVVCIFAAYLLLREGNAFRPDGYIVYAVLFFLTGTLGIVIGAKPVWLRDWFEAARNNCRVRWISAGSFGVAALLFLGGGIVHLFT